MKASIRAALLARQAPEAPPERSEQGYWSPEQTAAYFGVSTNLIKKWMATLYPLGIAHDDLYRYGNPTTTPSLRRYITERYAPAAIEKLKNYLHRN